MILEAVAYLLIIGTTFVIVKKISDWKGDKPDGVVPLRHIPDDAECSKLREYGCDVVNLVKHVHQK